MLERLIGEVLAANRALPGHGLVTLTWGNVSGIDRSQGLVAIKASGVSYEDMTAADMVVVDLDGNVVSGGRRPSTDTPTHLVLYRAFEEVGGIVHTHSTWATAWAQSQREIPLLGTTHADLSAYPIPVTRPLRAEEVDGGYEAATGAALAEAVGGRGALQVPCALARGHAPFCWSETVAGAVEAAVTLEAVARIALLTLQLDADLPPLADVVRDKHFERKHGPNAYYGQAWSAGQIEVVLAEDAIERLPATVGAPALVVMDANTREAVGDRVLGALRGAGVDAEALEFEQRSGLAASLKAVECVRAALDGGRLPVAVGSGVITDIVRYAAHQLDLDFISVPTAASMDGYASSVAPLELEGVKVTFPARAPRAIFADPRVIANAPAELTRAGIGDLLGKATARVDWLAAHLLYGESFDPDAAGLVLGSLRFATANVEAVLGGEPRAALSLLEGLIQSGVAMAIVGTSRPASGCEHHASHFWDLLAARGGRPPAPHGLQVGYATRFAMRLQRFAFGGGVPALDRPVVPGALSGAAREWLGQPTAEILAAVEEKQRFVAELGEWPDTAAGWKRVVSGIAPALELFPDIDRALTLAGIPAEPGYLGLDERTLRATFRYSTRLRARYTTVDFLEGQGLLEQAIEAMLAGPA